MADLFEAAARDERIKELEKLITRYQNSYYNGEAEISDAEFDKLWDELKTLDSKNAILQRVGADSGNFKKVRHIMPMGSQEKAADPEQFKAWAVKHAYKEYFVEYKLDGASLELQYESGKLMRCVTRGDGTTGDDITANAVKMKGVISVLKNKNSEQVPFTGGIRGEVIMTHDVHKKYYSDKANCRNAANGIMKRKDGKGSEHLQLIVYDAWETATGGETSADVNNSANGKSGFFSDEEEKIAWLKSLGFETSPLKICHSVDEVISYRAEIIDARKKIDYDIDGLVVKERHIDKADASRARPDRQIAFKFSLEEAVTILREVEWSKNGGTYTPVAIFDAVELAGTTVQRASLANPDTMRALGVKIGSRVVVVKRGEIIPKIEAVLAEESPASENPLASGDSTASEKTSAVAENSSASKSISTSEIIFPEKCEVCGTPLLDEGSRLFCPNKNCPKRVLHQLLKWISVVDIRDLGEKLITQLFESGTVKSISDLYTLTEETLTPFFLNEESIMKEKKSLGAEKVIRSINSHKNMKLATFVGAFDIEGIGETSAEKIVAAGYDTLEKMLSATEEQIANVYGFAEKMAHIAVEGLAENASEMRHLANGIINIAGVATGSLSGKSFCFTGELSMKRADAEKLVKDAGGSIKSSVTKDLSYLVTNDTTSGSSKNKKAASFGIPVIDEKQFMELIGN